MSLTDYLAITLLLLLIPGYRWLLNRYTGIAAYTQLSAGSDAAGLATGVVEESRLGRNRLHLQVQQILLVSGGWCVLRWLGLGALPALLVAGGFGVFLQRGSARRATTTTRSQIEFALPLLMERIVMGVHSGLDVLGALRVASSDSAAVDTGTPDPLTRLCQRVIKLTEAGRPFEESLRETAAQSGCPALHHAFTHLALAHRQGGELITPLRELSTATQLSYQENIEEEIAKLPVRATLPLLCTFAGLILCFITIPIIQVVRIMVASTPQ